MRRVHLIELEDQPWCPPSLRDTATDYLQATQHLMDLYAPISELLAGALQRTQTRTVIDLCSGGTGPWLRLLKHLDGRGAQVDVALTDRFPNADAFARAQIESEGRISGHAASDEPREA